MTRSAWFSYDISPIAWSICHICSQNFVNKFFYGRHETYIFFFNIPEALKHKKKHDNKIGFFSKIFLESWGGGPGPAESENDILVPNLTMTHDW